MNKVLFGIVWCVVLYFGICGIVGGVAGAKAGRNARGSAMASQLGGIAGGKAVRENHIVIVAGAIALAIAGSATGILPGTRQA